MLHAEYMRSTNLSIINFTPVFTIWSWLLWHIQRPPKCYVRSKPTSAYTKYLFWRVLNVLLTKSSSKSCLTLFLKRGCGRSPFKIILKYGNSSGGSGDFLMSSYVYIASAGVPCLKNPVITFVYIWELGNKYFFLMSSHNCMHCIIFLYFANAIIKSLYR